jgi:hypothetical protein
MGCSAIGWMDNSSLTVSRNHPKSIHRLLSYTPWVVLHMSNVPKPPHHFNVPDQGWAYVHIYIYIRK